MFTEAPFPSQRLAKIPNLAPLETLITSRYVRLIRGRRANPPSSISSGLQRSSQFDTVV